MSITVHSFTLEAGSSLAFNPSVKNMFIEYHFLNYDSSELETPSSLPKPNEGEDTSRKVILTDRERYMERGRD